MNQKQRQDLIVERIRMTGQVTTKELADELSVSSMTIGRDLKELANQQIVELFHGGAVYKDANLLEYPMSIKEDVSVEEKKMIAKYCKNLVKNGDAVFIETGTTTLFVAQELFSFKYCNFFSNSLLVLNALSKIEGIMLHSIPGKYRELSKGFLGIETASYIRSYHFDICFIGTEGIDAQGNVTLLSEEDTFTKQAIMAQSKINVLVADHTKFEKIFFCKIGNIREFDWVITDLNECSELFKKLKQLNPNLISV
ncbi:DeoR/GlpR transcriptional regulator [Enterococcus sp. BWB1-3]|uniref:DeoR/GlpR family DNA-binding transcription regulator n=1 Tax=Enterococcus sp. BWB1-3 TaxID=2787713 RepID=UPI0019238E6A|nr:DeoR/GlpR family DNA-binding transcription regulator [Enterococcus sp. BWB1-3]MBL1229166.1 DeoR/GlpR transcriptional regulator [Enterococcus sp. BWB1-3]